MPNPVQELKEHIYEINAIHAALSIMSWDQQVLMPEGGADARAEHLTSLTRLAHIKSTSDEVKRSLEESTKVAEGEDADLVRVTQRHFDLLTKIPTELAARKAKLGAKGHQEWVIARKTNNFKTFEPTLKEMFETVREEAECIGYKEHIYDALLDQYEEGATHAEAKAMFDGIRGPLTQLVKEIGDKPAVDDSFFYGTWSTEDQSKIIKEIATAIGFDFSRGRLDTAPHPFCTGWSVGDIRITTRFLDHLLSAISSSMHEAGHGMYEQGSPKKWDRLPLAGGVSLGIHESQSRFWENIIGRSEGFWKYFHPRVAAAFPQIKDVPFDKFLKAFNKVTPSLIRVESDEVTYNLHIMIRFDLESDLLTGKLAVHDLPEAWNAKYKEYLGITPPSDSDGCLQDVHWSEGLIGYFPTYSMGNLLSYQFWASLQKDLPNAEANLEKGEFAPIHDWLLEKIYRKGHSIPPKDLVKQVTGKAMSADDYMAGIQSKYRALYDIH